MTFKIAAIARPVSAIEPGSTLFTATADDYPSPDRRHAGTARLVAAAPQACRLLRGAGIAGIRADDLGRSQPAAACCPAALSAGL